MVADPPKVKRPDGMEAVNRRYRRRWLCAFWGTHVIGIGLWAACVDVSWWAVLGWTCAYLTGWVAAVLVELTT